MSLPPHLENPAREGFLMILMTTETIASRSSNCAVGLITEKVKKMIDANMEIGKTIMTNQTSGIETTVVMIATMMEMMMTKRTQPLCYFP
ncbi:hypothetical protein SAMN05444358_11150 [Ruegeria halocynthiae]|uniref:Uncharacterized protein n=1 Tax=Ruegeria halocynthiae TaxID=985054 RepID=A0A1H3EI40_9RHOB|nr:hypothetical protein SAMN05444358_11150 [Ruegeria halocynthiae]